MSKAQRRVDWHRVFEDFAYLGMTGEALAQRIELPVSLLQAVATGKRQPAPRAAERIASLWCSLTGKPAQFLHRTNDAEGTPRGEIPNIESDEECEPSYAQLEAMTLVWRQILRIN